MTIEEYRAAILQALLELRMRTALQPLLQRKHRKHSMDLPTMSCRDGVLWNSPEDVADQLSLRE